MRVLYIIDGLNAGGKERRLTELLKNLSKEKVIEFELVTMTKEIYYKDIFDLNIKIHYIIRKTRKDISIFKKFYKICRNFKPDIVHCWDGMTAIYAIPACRLLNIKLVNGMVADSPAKRNIFNKYWLRAKVTFPFSDIIVGNSKSGLKAYKAPKNKSIYIYNGFDFKRIDNIVKNDIIRTQLKITSKFVIGMVASFSKYKDYKTYFTSAQLLLSKRNDITFVAIGDNTDSDLSKNLIDNKYIENFRLLGKKSGIESFINSMDICVLSTFTEGISNSILEYMALGKPVIATSGGGTNEIVEDNKTGFLIKSLNPKELAEKIDFLLNDTELCLNMGIRGQKRIHELFSINSMTSKFISCYKMVLGVDAKKVFEEKVL